MCVGAIWHGKGRESVLASQSVNGFVFATRRYSFATERSCVNDRVPVCVHLRVLELKVK